MNQKLVFCITFLVIICCDVSISFAALENNMGDFDDINKTLTIYDNESKLMTVRLISAVPDLCTFTEIFEVSNFEAYTPDSKADFTARTDTVVGSGAVTDTEWFIEQNTSYIVNVADYGIKEVEEIIFNNKTGKNETVLINKTVITGYHDETRYKDVWVDHQPYGKVISTDQVQRVKVVYHKVPELGPFRIQTVPMFRGVECSELTWWSGSWDRRRAIQINNTGGDSVTDYQLKSVNLSSYNINASSARIVNDTSNLEESFWNEIVDSSRNLEYVWCNYSSLPNGAWINSTYKIYYQTSSGVSSSSSIQDTYILGDDFADGDYTSNPVWTVRSGTWSAADCYLKKTSANGWEYISIPSTSDTVVWEYKAAVGYVQQFFFMSSTTNTGTTNGYFVYLADSPDRIMLYKSVGGSHLPLTNVAQSFDGAFHDIKITRDSSNKFKIYYDDALKITHTDATYSTSSYIIQRANYQNTDQIDDIRIRKYTANEPEPWTVGAEEEYVAPTPTPTPASTTSVSPVQYDELDLPLILYILMISLLYLFIAFRHGVATIELSLIYLIFAFFFLLFQTITISVNYIYLILFLLVFLISIAGITKQGVD